MLQEDAAVLARLDDAGMPVGTAGEDDERRKPLVVLARGHLGGYRLVGAEDHVRGGPRWRSMHIEIGGDPRCLLRVDRCIHGHEG